MAPPLPIALTGGEPAGIGPDLCLAAAIASLGAGLGMSTVAEGVETKAQAEMVRKAGVTVVQGYLIARPTPESAVPLLIRRLEVGYDPDSSLPIQVQDFRHDRTTF